jgi:hypothetical protein
MKVAEGIVRFCPLTLLYEQYMQSEQKPNVSNSSDASRDSMEGLNEDHINI